MGSNQSSHEQDEYDEADAFFENGDFVDQEYNFSNEVSSTHDDHLNQQIDEETDNINEDYKLKFWEIIILFNNIYRSKNIEPSIIDTIFQYAKIYPKKEYYNNTLSNDQGWSSYPQHHGTRIGSYTWGEVSLSENGQRYEVYRNIHAGDNWEMNEKEFDESSPLIIECNSINNQSNIILWKRSSFPGWENNVSNARIIITYNLTNLNQLIQTYNY